MLDNNELHVDDFCHLLPTWHRVGGDGADGDADGGDGGAAEAR